MQAKIETNANEVFAKLETLTLKETNSAMRAAVNTVKRKVRSVAQKNLTSRVKGANKKSKYSDTLKSGVRANKTRSNKKKHTISATVTILPNKKVSNSGSFRLPMLEGGTKMRKTRKGYNRGMLTATHFFSDALTTSERDLQANLAQAIQQAVNRINNKKIGGKL